MKNQINVLDDDQEYKQVRKDLIFVIIMNVIFAAIVIGLFLFNRSTGKVDQFFSNLLKF